MVENNHHQKRPDPERLEVLKRFPAEVMKRLTREEVNAFLYDEVWPESLRDKLGEYLVDLE